MWARMALIVESNPRYDDASPAAFHDAVASLAMQALTDAILTEAGAKTPKVVLGATGRTIGMVIAQAPNDDAKARGIRFVAEMIAVGENDYLKVRGDELAAKLEAGR